MNIVFHKTESHGKVWKENIWFSTSKVQDDRQLIPAFYGESEIYDGCEFPHPGTIDCCCFEFILHGQGVLTTSDNSRFPLFPGAFYALLPRQQNRISVSPQYELKKVIVGFPDGVLLQLLLHNSPLWIGEVIKMPKDGEFNRQLQKIGEMVKSGSVAGNELSVESYRLMLQITQKERSKTTNSLQKICEYMQSRLSSPLTLDDIALKYGMSKPTLIRKFRSQFSCTPMQYLITLRLDYARNLLRFKHLPVAQVAELCGYRDVKFFSREYHRHFGNSPSDEKMPCFFTENDPGADDGPGDRFGDFHY